MKKPACILWVAILTMATAATTVFAQSQAGISETIVVTNKTTNEPATITFGNLNNSEEGGNVYVVPKSEFRLGIYAGDEIEVSYNSNIGVKPSLAWEYTIGSYVYDGGTSLTSKLTVPKLPSDNQAM